MAKSVYLIISHVTKVARSINTNKKGLANNPDNWETFENMILADRVSNANLRASSVVIDLLNGKVIKNRFELSNSEVFREYVDKYQADIGEALKRWGSQDADNYKKLKSLAAEAEGAKTNDTEANPD